MQRHHYIPSTSSIHRDIRFSHRAPQRSQLSQSIFSSQTAAATAAKFHRFSLRLLLRTGCEIRKKYTHIYTHTPTRPSIGAKNSKAERRKEEKKRNRRTERERESDQQSNHKTASQSPFIFLPLSLSLYSSVSDDARSSRMTARALAAVFSRARTRGEGDSNVRMQRELSRAKEFPFVFSFQSCVSY